MLEWEDIDRYSFKDSDRFEEDSISSWVSEREPVVNNWRGWRKYLGQPGAPSSTYYNQQRQRLLAQHAAAINAVIAAPAGAGVNNVAFNAQFEQNPDIGVLSLTELAAREVAASLPFELVEAFYPPVPEQLQLRIAFWSFPEQEEDIRLYSCLANGSSEEFAKGEHLFKQRSVKEPIQIGFHLSATVEPSVAGKQSHNTSVTFDRKNIVDCRCSCRDDEGHWCAHVVALCLQRINEPESVLMRAPVSESLSRLQRDQLQKFAQYLIQALPQHILPIAQKILDNLLSGSPSDINEMYGAPDPTAGGAVGEKNSWCIDRKNLRDNIKKILIKFCIPAPIVFSDVNSLTTTAPPSSLEWTSFLRPLRGREPEGMWNLLSIVREMYKRHDRNAVPLLETITQQCLEISQVMVWWYNAKISLTGRGGGGGGGGGGNKQINTTNQAAQYACASMCDEVVTLWRLAAINPCISPQERELLCKRLTSLHLLVAEKIQMNVNGTGAASGNRPAGQGHGHNGANSKSKQSDMELFPGFKPAIEACSLCWDDYPIPGITYGHNSHYLSPFTVLKGAADVDDYSQSSQVNSSQAVLLCEYPRRPLSNGLMPSGWAASADASAAVVDEAEEAVAGFPAGVPSGGPSAEPSAGPSGSRQGCRPKASKNASRENGRMDRRCQARRNSSPVRSSSSSCNDDDYDEGLDVSGADCSSSRKKGQPGVIRGRKGPFQRASLSDDQDESGNESLADNGNFREGHQAQEEDDEEDDDEDDAAGREDHHQPESGAAGASSPPSAGEATEDGAAAGGAGQGPNNGPYNIYFYDPKELGAIQKNGPNFKGQAKGLSSGPPQSKAMMNGQNQQAPDIFKNLRKTITDPWEVLFMRAEGIYAHGYHARACQMAVQLANDLLKNPPHLVVDFPPFVTKGKRKRLGAACHAITITASTTLAHCAFLCTVLSENPNHTHLAFQVGLFGLELARLPASTKPMEVKLAFQEAEIAGLLKKISLGPEEIKAIRQKAKDLKDGRLKARGEALLPLTLASYIFESLNSFAQNGSGSPGADESLGFDAAVAALGLKTKVSEADHPLLCEGIRRQRGELALLLLVTYKNDPQRLAKIMEKMLDKEVHSMFKAPVLASFYVSNPRASGAQRVAADVGGWNNPPARRRDQDEDIGQMMDAMWLDDRGARGGAGAGGGAIGDLDMRWINNEDPNRGDHQHHLHHHYLHHRHIRPARNDGGIMDYNDIRNDNARGQRRGHGGPGSDSGSSGNSTGDSMDSSSSSGRLRHEPDAAAARAGVEAGAAAQPAEVMPDGARAASPILALAPQPALDARARGAAEVGGVGAAFLGNNLHLRGSDQPMSLLGLPCPLASTMRQLSALNEISGSARGIRSAAANCMKPVGGRFKGKRIYPLQPNQPSESSAHFMFELAKQVLAKAGGNSTTSLFTQPINNQNAREPNRALQMCAFQLALYSLGLHNRVNPNWLQRTYSSHVSWIMGQAMDIGANALTFIMYTWPGHLTPTEAAGLADNASKARDPQMVRAAAELALSVLPQAADLNPNEIQRAIMQCKDQGHSMLEKALTAVELASEDGSVCPDVMFQVGRHWYYLYEKYLLTARRISGSAAGPSSAPIVAAAARPLGLRGGLLGANIHPPAAAPVVRPPLLGAAPDQLLPQGAGGAGSGGAGLAGPAPHLMHQLPLQALFQNPPPQLGQIPNQPPPPQVPNHPPPPLGVHHQPPNVAQQAPAVAAAPPAPPPQLAIGGQLHLYSLLPGLAAATSGNPAAAAAAAAAAALYVAPHSFPHQVIGLGAGGPGLAGSLPAGAVAGAQPPVSGPALPGGGLVYPPPPASISVGPFGPHHQQRLTLPPGGPLYPFGATGGAPFPLGGPHLVANQLPPPPASPASASASPNPAIAANQLQIVLANQLGLLQQHPVGSPASAAAAVAMGHLLQQQILAQQHQQPQQQQQILRPLPGNSIPQGGNGMVNLPVGAGNHPGQPPVELPAPHGAEGANENGTYNGGARVNAGNSQGQRQQPQPPHKQQQDQEQHRHQRYLLAAYSIGMLALEYIGRKVGEERPQEKFQRIPTYADDVKWLFNISTKLGVVYVQSFLTTIINRMISPFLIEDLVYESGRYFAIQVNSLHPQAVVAGAAGVAVGASSPAAAGGGPPHSLAMMASPSHNNSFRAANSFGVSSVPTDRSRGSRLVPASPFNTRTSRIEADPVTHQMIVQQIRSNPQLTQLLQKCFQSYYHCIHQRLFHVTADEYDEFVSVLVHAKETFHWTPEGITAFSSLLQTLRRSKACNKELFQKIVNVVNQPGEVISASGGGGSVSGAGAGPPASLAAPGPAQAMPLPPPPPPPAAGLGPGIGGGGLVAPPPPVQRQHLLFPHHHQQQQQQHHRQQQPPPQQPLPQPPNQQQAPAPL